MMATEGDGLGSVTERLARNHYDVDEENSHIHIDQDIARRTGTGKLLVRVCPAHVYSEEPDGTISVEYAACLECGVPGSRCSRIAGMALPHRCGGNFIQRRLTDLSGWLWSDIDGTRWEILRWLHKKAVGMKPVGGTHPQSWRGQPAALRNEQLTWCPIVKDTVHRRASSLCGSEPICRLRRS